MPDKPPSLPKKAVVEFVNLGEFERPSLEVTRIDAKGKRHKLEVDAEGAFSIDRQYVGKNNKLEFRSSRHGEPRKFAYDEVIAQLTDGRFELAPGIWRYWIGIRTCVGGKAEVCRPYFPWRPFPDVIRELDLGFRDSLSELIFEPRDPIIISPLRCDPICHGKVEIFLKTCCCHPIVIDPPIIIEDLCRIIGCRFPWPIDPIDPPIDWPPIRIKELMLQATEKALKDARKRQEAIAEPVIEAARHLGAMMLLESRQAQREYIEAHPFLLHRFCHCTTTKVGETHLGPGGTFNHCFWRWPLFRPNCTQTVAYKVSQIQDTDWVLVYDGLAKGEFFGLDETAELRASWEAEVCDNPAWPDPDGIKPFIALEQVGTTWADVLMHSTNQDGETSFGGPLLATDGLAWEAPPAANLFSGPYEQPWATTLSLRFQFHAGLEGLGVKYFRIRQVRVNGAGNLVNERIHTGDLSWRKYYDDSGTLKVKWVPLHVDPSTVGGQQGLYEIPFYDPVLPWLGGQWHAHVNTLATDSEGAPLMPNGRYLLVIDVFDSSGSRLEPTNAGGATDFEYRRLDGPLDSALASTSIVPHKALANLFRVDNTPSDADIQALKVNGLVPSDASCQFLEGSPTDQLAIQYEARQITGFQWRHWIRLKQGLSGPTRYTTDVGFGNWSTALSDSEMPGGASSLTVGMTFGDLLSGEARCTFAADLRVQTKHTNGQGRRINTYDRSDLGSFALLIA